MLVLVVLVVLPLTALVWGSVTEQGRLTLDHFRSAFAARLYYQALLTTR
jgi:ABC-type sulfate transport system permease component